jgi:hypothetical protein
MWRKSSHSKDAEGCVELRRFNLGTVGVRDSKNTALPHLCLTPEAVRTLATRIKNGDLDLLTPTL